MKILYFAKQAFFIFSLLLLLPFSCRKDDTLIDKLEPPKIANTDNVEVTLNGPAPEFRTRVYIFDEETANQIVSLARTKITIKKGAVLRGARVANVAASQIKIGDVMAAGKTSQTPQGFNRKVTGVKESKDGTEIEIDTEDASFEDIFKNASFTIKKSLEESASLDYTLSRSTGSSGSGIGVELKTSGTASISFGLEIPVEVKEYSLKKIEAKVVVNPKVNLSISATDKITTSEIELPVLNKTFAIVAIVPVGAVPFPVVLTPKIRMAVTGEAGLEGSITFNALDINYKSELGAGYESSRGIYGINVSNKPENKSGQIVDKIKGFVKTGFKTTLSLSFYDLDYVTFGDDVNLYAKLEGECSSDGSGKADVLITGGLNNSAFAKFDLFGLKDNKASSDSFTFVQLKFKLDNSLCGNTGGDWNLFVHEIGNKFSLYRRVGNNQDVFDHDEAIVNPIVQYSVVKNGKVEHPPIQGVVTFKFSCKKGIWVDSPKFIGMGGPLNYEVIGTNKGYMSTCINHYISPEGVRIEDDELTVTVILPDGKVLKRDMFRR